MSTETFINKPILIASVLFGLMFTANVWAGDITLHLEEPAAGSTYTGIANIRGYAYSKQAKNIVPLRDIELYIDGQALGTIPFGGQRDDVTADPNSGFSMAFNYSSLTPGQHRIEIIAVDQQGKQEKYEAAFNTVRFNFAGDFLHDPSKINLTGSQVSQQGNRMTINNMSADGRQYDIELTWNTAMQNFSITKIAAKSGNNIPNVSGKYDVKYGYKCASASGSSKYVSFTDSGQTNGVPMTQNGSSITLGNKWTGEVAANADYILVREVNQVLEGCRFTYLDGFIGNFNSGALKMGIELDGYTKSCPSLPPLTCTYTVEPVLKRTGPL